MKTLGLFLMSFVFLNVAQSQTAYIQVNGEAGLSVYLDNSYKGLTKAELNGLIIGDVTPGSHLIRVEKKGYTPYEETITVKKGEVFEYKVKPFKKRPVTIRETGNSGESEKKADVPGGTLLVQSVPIQIKITMPAVEGVKDLQKNKDKWTVENLAAGTYQITFRFNNKEIKKEVDILGDNTTTVFINMLTGEFTEKNTFDEKYAAEMTRKKAAAFVDLICKEYKFKSGLSKYQFSQYNPDAAFLFNIKPRVPESYSVSKTAVGPAYVSRYNYLGDFVDEVDSYTYNVVVSSDQASAENKWKEFVDRFKENANAKYLNISSGAGYGTCYLEVPDAEVDHVRVEWKRQGKQYVCAINFFTNHKIFRRRNNR